MNLKQLKNQVYGRAQVTSTSALKQAYPQLKGLDFRYRASWEQCLALLSDESTEFEQWRANPPAEYRELFQEVASLSQRQNQLMTQAKQEVAKLGVIAHQTEAIAQTLQEEAIARNHQQRLARKAREN